MRGPHRGGQFQGDKLKIQIVGLLTESKARVWHAFTLMRRSLRAKAMVKGKFTKERF